MGRSSLIAILLSVFAGLALPTVSADESKTEGLLNKLLAPGPLIHGHKDLERSDCLKCHTPREGIPDSNCLECHKEIQPSVEQKRGFHGQVKKSCTECHSDHHGRDFDSTKVDQKDFDHSKTGYVLEGKHADLKCSECHIEKRSQAKKVVRPNDMHFLGLKTSCVSCHEEDDPHHYPKTSEWGKKDCDACHGKKSWDENVRFNHAKDARYRLEGKHADLECAECHIPKGKAPIYRWKDLEKSKCLSCHADQHKGNFGQKFQNGDCLKCHTQTTWKIQHFDHSITGHTLKGKHAEAKCVDCHKQTKPVIKLGLKAFHFTGLKKECLSCHVDQHKGKFSPKFQGGDCLKCHTESSWKIERFDHSITGYTLKGKHAEIKCVDCHKQKPAIEKQGVKSFHFAGLKKDCLSCHKDEHLFGPLKTKIVPNPNDCLSCHTEKSWKKDLKFDHSRDTQFEIAGKHEGLACAKCHTVVPKAAPTRRLYLWGQALQTKTCENCHANPHNTFSREFKAKRCTECHVDTGWNDRPRKSAFDHSATRFKLDGKHKDASCKDCHGSGKQQVFRFASANKQFCVDCHKDIHVGQFSKKMSEKSCADCHTTTDFTRRKIFDHSITRFKIDGKHEDLDCLKCHVATKEPLIVEALGRPKPNNNQPHPPVKMKSRFLFNESASRGFCDSCHQNVHQGQFHGSFSTKSCGTCHTTNDFIRRKEFNHSDTLFALRGKHMDLKCEKCHVATHALFPPPSKHRKGRFLFPEIAFKDCAACHKDPHDGSFGKKCSDCHQEQNWKSTQDFHKNFTLSGIHYSLECSECHRGGRRLAGMSQNCALCHQKDDIHNGTLPNCGSCHLQHFWEVSKFRHSLTNFPLRGAHRTLDCSSCHSNGIYKGTPTQCIACHLNDALSVTNPVHGPTFLQRSCSDCHNAFSFR